MASVVQTPVTVRSSHRAPPVDRLPAAPAAWYLLCASREVNPGPVSKQFAGRTLVAFRTASGSVAVMDGRCSHLGADLGRGRVVGDAIECPFHGWRYAADGRCTFIPAAAEVPRFARQATYPVVERHGLVFFFNGREPLFPLPFFADARPEDYVPGVPFRFVGECTWYMLASNGFDGAHFAAVHDRIMLGPATVDCPAEFARRYSYTARVTGRSLADRFIRLSLGDVVEVSITNWGGPLILVAGRFRRARSLMLIATQPLPPDRTLVETIVFAPRSRSIVGRWLQPLGLRMRRCLTQKFLQDDVDRLAGITYSPLTMIEADRDLVEFFAWLSRLPEGTPMCLARPQGDNQRD
ncbi:MAG: Rieske 2Fe-2S domain-containing protein [Pirellulales bacterium]